MNQLTISGNVGGTKGESKMKINNIENLALHALMERYDACPESRNWLGDRDLKTALAECPNISWIFWLAAHMLERKQFVLLVIAAVQPAMRFVSDDDRPQECLDRLTEWANGEATLHDVQSAGNAAADAAAAATDAAVHAVYASAVHAAYAAAAAANAAVNAATATVHAADYAAYDATAAANAANNAADYATDAAAAAAVNATYDAAAAYNAANDDADYANDAAAAIDARIGMRNIIRGYIEIV